jgi:hypothetical protein
MLQLIGSYCPQFLILTPEQQVLYMYMLQDVDKNITMHFAFFLHKVYNVMGKK